MHTVDDEDVPRPCYRELILVRHAAKRLAISERTIRYLASTKRLPATRIGKKIWGFRPNDVESYRRLLRKRD